MGATLGNSGWNCGLRIFYIESSSPLAGKCDVFTDVIIRINKNRIPKDFSLLAHRLLGLDSIEIT